MGAMRQRNHSRPVVTGLARIICRLSAASFVMRTLVLGVVAMVISGIAHAIAQPARDNSDATYLVESIVAGEADLGQVPTEFVGDMGYAPVPASGTLRNPHGGCSTPGQVGPDRFDGACQTHDLGYDVLRYAEMEGTRLEAKARLELDWRLYVDLLQTCETPTCSLTATAYYCAVSANSIRQGYKTPHAEPTTPWMALVVGVLGLSLAGGLPSMKAMFDTLPHNGTDASRVRQTKPGRRSPGETVGPE